MWGAKVTPGVMLPLTKEPARCLQYTEYVMY